MGLNEYEVEIEGIGHTIQLDDEDAKKRGLTLPATKAAPEPKNKQRTPRDK